MPKGRARGGASIFSALPSDIKQHLRAQLNQVAPVTMNQSSKPLPQFISTQPAASDDLVDGAESDDVEEEEESVNRKRSNDDAAQSESLPPAKKRRVGAGVTSLSTSNRPKQTAEERWDCSGLVPRYTGFDEVPAHLKKYYAQRDFLFSAYDTANILLDETGWYSVTPESMAIHIAERCRADTVIDAFAGVGGNVIQLAMTCERVIAIDNDMTRLRLARHNAMQYGVADRVEWICADFVEFAEAYDKGIRLREAERKCGPVDVVFLSPPWGGVDYLGGAASERSKSDAPPVFALSKLKPVSAQELYRISSAFTPNLAFYLPKNVDLLEVSQLAPERMDELGVSCGRELVEVEEEHVGSASAGSKVKALTVYFGGLVNNAA